MSPLPIRKLKASGGKQAEHRAGILGNDSAAHSFKLTENKLGSFTYFHLLFPQTLFLSNIRTHTVNQVCICCNISLITFLPHEDVMASTHPTGAQSSCSWTQTKNFIDSTEDFLGFLLFSLCFLKVCCSYPHCSSYRQCQVCFGELQNTAIQLSQPFSGYLKRTGKNLETKQAKATLYKQNRCFPH